MNKFHFFHLCLFESKTAGHSSFKHALYIENTSWKVLAYSIYVRVVDVSEIERVSATNE